MKVTRTRTSTGPQSPMPHGAAASIVRSLVGWGIALGGLAGAVTGTLIGFLFAGMPGGSEVPVSGFAVGLPLGGGIGLLVGLACAAILAWLAPAVLSGRQEKQATAAMAAALAVALVFILFALWLSYAGWLGWPEMLLALTVPGLVAFSACMWAANRALTSLLELPEVRRVQRPRPRTNDPGSNTPRPIRRV